MVNSKKKPKSFEEEDKRQKSMLEEQIEKDLAFSLETGLDSHAIGPSSSYYLSVAQNHAEKIIKTKNKVVLRSGWKGDQEQSSVCKEWVKTGRKLPLKPEELVNHPKDAGKLFDELKKCGKPLTHVVSWEIERFYGKKHAELAFCESCAKNFVKSLKKGDKRIGCTFSYEPISIRRIEDE
jgi:hypothetical protein